MSAAINPSSEPQIEPSALFKQSAPSSASPSQPQASNIQPDRPTSLIPSTNGFNFASNLSQLRTPRARNHQITFHAPAESPSPSRTTQRSLSEPPIPTPPASGAPELGRGTPAIQEEQTTATAELHLQETEAAELPAQSQPHAPLDSQSAQAVETAEISGGRAPHTARSASSRELCPPPTLSQPESNLEPVRPDSRQISVKTGALNDNDEVLQPGVGDSYTVEPSGQSDDSQTRAMENLSLSTGATKTQAGTQNGFDEQRPRPFHEHKPRNQPNGHAHSNRNSVQSISSEDRPLPSVLEEHAFLPLSAHLSRLFLTKEWVDWSIEVNSPVPGLQPIGYMAHGILMARSPTLRQEMRRHLLSNRIDRIISLSPDRYVQPQAFEAALRYLYTESLLTKFEVEEMFASNGEGSDTLTREYQIDVVLSYWMAGLILGLRLVARQAVKLIHEIMDWDVLEFTFQQALTLGERTLKVTAELSNTNPNTPGSSPAGSATPASLPKILRSPFSPSDYSSPASYSDAAPRYLYPAINAVMSKKMKRIVYEFLGQRIDSSRFEMEDPPISILKSYLPDTREYSNSSRYRANPALAAIRFGSMPLAEEDAVPARTPSAMSRDSGHVTSAIMLNLRYTDLRQFCLLLENTIAVQQERGEATDIIDGHASHTVRSAGSQESCPPHGGDLRSWIQKIIAERERRRRKVLSSRTVSNQERLSKEQEWDVVGYEEHIEATDGLLGWELRRNWTGFTLPVRQ